MLKKILLIKKILLKAEVDKSDINKLVNDPTSLNNLKTTVDNLDIDKLKTVPIDLKKLSDVVVKKLLKRQCITH